MLSSWDQSIFFFINNWQLPEWLDWLLIQWRHQATWIPLYVLMTVLLIKLFKRKGILIVLFAMACSGFSDFTNSQLLKKSVERIRPCNELTLQSEIELKVHCGSGYSFPSSHASNHMALAVFVLLAAGNNARKFTFWLLPWAVIVGLAQVYVGVHYPLDVLAGFAWGSILAYSFFVLYKRIVPSIKS